VSPLHNLMGEVATEGTLQDILGRLDGDHAIGYVGDLMMVTAAAGELYIGGAGRLVLTEAGNTRGLLANPADSGKLCYIVRISFFSSALGFAHFRVNPTTGRPAIASTTSNALLQAVPPSAMQVGFDTHITTQLGGGTLLGNVVGLAAGVRTSLDLPPLILPPGNSWGFNVPYSTPADFVCSIYWVERDL